IRGGVYVLDRPLEFGPEDSGTSQYSITYAAYPGDKPILSGGRVITGWNPGPDNMWTVKLKDVKNGTWWFRQLYRDGQRLARGRYPAKGFFKIKRVSKDYTKLEFTMPLSDRDMGAQDTEVVVVQNWSIARELIDKSSTKEIQARTPIGWVGHMACLPKPGMSVFFEHALAFVQTPGQWYLDRKSGVLYYKAAEGENPNQRQFAAPVLEQLVYLDGQRNNPIHNLHFDGIGFEHTGFLIPDMGYGGTQGCYYGTSVEAAVTYAVPVAIDMAHCQGCSITNARLARIGASGIGLGQGCVDNRIVGCELSDIGATGVNIGHMKVKDPLWADWSDPRDVPANNEVANCYIHHCGAELWGGHGIFDAMTRDTKIRHNEIAHLAYGGVATGFVWNTDRTSQQGCLIEYNHIHEVMHRLNDSGCIYTLGFQPGSIIRGNLMHGVRIGGYAHGTVCNNGIFLDQGSKGFLVEDNVIYDVDQKAGAKNSAIRFNVSHRDWHIWINNAFDTADEAPEAAKGLAEKAGLELEYKSLLKDGPN
ncbi:MAG: right-handed parallel beta-helix repeat-containing protein, partial [Planctomycetes bacterium]|nr:right-handed parallel beta-helix repeat-containing protein [Planctomycetota bacterium]